MSLRSPSRNGFPKISRRCCGGMYTLMWCEQGATQTAAVWIVWDFYESPMCSTDIFYSPELQFDVASNFVLKLQATSKYIYFKRWQHCLCKRKKALNPQRAVCVPHHAYDTELETANNVRMVLLPSSSKGVWRILPTARYRQHWE